MRAQQKGFTLVELVVVIVILGILAAVAIPRYVGFTRDARIAALNGVAGAARSGVGLVQARWVASGSTGTTVTMADTTAVTVTGTAPNGGIPISDTNGISNAVTIQGFTYAPGAASGTFNLVPTLAGCEVTYSLAGVVTVVPTNC